MTEMKDTVVPWDGSYVRQCQTCGFANTLGVKLLLPGHESDKNPYHGLSWDENPLPPGYWDDHMSTLDALSEQGKNR